MICKCCGNPFIKVVPHQSWCSDQCRVFASNTRYFSKSDVKERRNAARREQRRLAKVRRKKQGEQQRAAIAAMFKESRP